ncbi:MAG: co-chaperone GroES [Planctomycetaceae bacterium]
MRVTPIGDNVVLKRIEAEPVSAGGVLLPETARESGPAPAEGRVLSVGDGVRLEDGTFAEPQVCEGDRVLYSPWAGLEVRLDGEDLLILSESDILAVLG